MKNQSTAITIKSKHEILSDEIIVGDAIMHASMRAWYDMIIEVSCALCTQGRKWRKMGQILLPQPNNGITRTRSSCALKKSSKKNKILLYGMYGTTSYRPCTGKVKLATTTQKMVWYGEWGNSVHTYNIIKPISNHHHCEGHHNIRQQRRNTPIRKELFLLVALYPSFETKSTTSWINLHSHSSTA